MILHQLWSLAKGAFTCVKAFYISNVKGQKTNIPLMSERLSMCAVCPIREEDKCGECGCYLKEKASLTDPEEGSVCPMGFWENKDSFKTYIEINGK